jgi:hypothetical protein
VGDVKGKNLKLLKEILKIYFLSQNLEKTGRMLTVSVSTHKS